VEIYTKYFNLPDKADMDESLKNWSLEFPHGGAFVLISEKNSSSIPEIQEIFQKYNLSLIGSVFPLVIYEASFKEGAVCVFYKQMPEYFISSEFNLNELTARNIEKGIQNFCSPILNQLDKEDKPGSLFLIFDCILPFIASAVNQIFMTLEDRVSYMGINAGSETFQSIPCIFNREKIYKNAIAGILFPESLTPILEHGYKIPDSIIAATSTDKNQIISIDWKPAFEVYKTMIEKHYGINISQDNFYNYAVHYPFGIILADGEVIVRIPVSIDDKGSLYCVGEVPENSIMTLLISPDEASHHTVNSLKNRLEESSEDLMFFYCAGRKMHLGENKALSEIAMLADSRKNKVLFGALTLGEIGSLRNGGIPVFHNATIICVPFTKS